MGISSGRSECVRERCSGDWLVRDAGVAPAYFKFGAEVALKIEDAESVSRCRWHERPNEVALDIARPVIVTVPAQTVLPCWQQHLGDHGAHAHALRVLDYHGVELQLLQLKPDRDVTAVAVAAARRAVSSPHNKR